MAGFFFFTPCRWCLIRSYICRMKWFEVTTSEEAQALRPYAVHPPKKPSVGDRVSPETGVVFATYWPDYPEADRLTFEECMAIVRDEVTVDVMRELGGDQSWAGASYEGETWTGLDIGDAAVLQCGDESGRVELSCDCLSIPNLTATKLRILVAILKGEKI